MIIFLLLFYSFDAKLHFQSKMLTREMNPLGSNDVFGAPGEVLTFPDICAFFSCLETYSGQVSQS